MKRVLTYLLLIILQINFSFGQESEPDLQKIIEAVLPIVDEDQTHEDLLEIFMEFLSRPIDLNSAGPSELQGLYLLSLPQIDSLLTYRSKYGDILSIHELYLIDGLDSSTIEAIRPFITFASNFNKQDSLSIFKNLISTSKRSLMLRYGRILEPRTGQLNRNIGREAVDGRFYLGSPDQIYGRIQIDEPNDFRLGFTFEKDAGEPWFINIPKRYIGFDHYSGFFHLENRGLIKGLTIGDFQLQAGQGLVTGSGLFNGKGTLLKRTNKGIRPYQGVTEYGFFRGMAINLGKKRWSATGYFSYKNQDVTLLSGSEKIISGFKRDGYHRTFNELIKRGNINEKAAGLNTTFYSLSKNFTIGLNALFYQYNLPIKENNGPYEVFQTYDKARLAGSLYFDYYKGKFNVFGEAAMDGNSGIATVNGVMINLSSRVESFFLARYYSPGYTSAYGGGFSEFSNHQNEVGMYWGLKIMPIPKIAINAYYDLFKSPWLRPNRVSFDWGHEYLIKMTWKISWYSLLSLAFREQNKDDNLLNEFSSNYITVSGVKRNLQLLFRKDSESGFSLQSRVDGSMFDFYNRTTKGIALAQDIGYAFKSLDINFRFAYFNTDDYENRQYMYERDLFLYYSIPAYYGKGFRFYGMIKYDISRNIDGWIKAGTYIFQDRDVIGSGLSAIPGNKKTEIKCQLRIKF